MNSSLHWKLPCLSHRRPDREIAGASVSLGVGIQTGEKEPQLTALSDLGASIVWLVGPEELGAEMIIEEAAHQAEQRGDRSLHIRAQGRRAHTFFGLKQLLMGLEPILRQEAPALLQAYDTEWVTLFPEAREDTLFQQARHIDEIALPASERRLSRESEQVFRIINRGVTLILDALEQCPSLAERQLWIWIDRLDEADRQTVHTIHHICRRGHPRIRVIASLRRMPTSETAPVPNDHAIDPVRRLLNDRQVAERFLEAVYHDLAPAVIHLEPWSVEEVRLFIEDQRPAWLEHAEMLQKWSGGAPLLLKALLERGTLTADGPEVHWEPLENDYFKLYRATYASQTVCAAAGLQPPPRMYMLLMERLNAGPVPDQATVLSCHRRLLDALSQNGCPLEWTEEEYQSHLCYHAFQAGEIEAGFQYLQAALTRSITWGNYENVLVLDKQALRALQHKAPSAERQIRFWKWCGLIHAYLGNFAEAIEAYEQALANADDSPTRAQIYAYLSLLATKRMGNHNQATTLLEAGLEQIASREDEASIIERVWLYNIKALSLFLRKQYTEALKLCKQGYTLVKPYHSGDVLHLKINLISNMSVVFEETGDVATALKTWHAFRQFLREGNQLFQKVYYYREGGLLLKLGDTSRAIEAFVRSYQEAEAIHDTFHMDFIARDVGALYYHTQQWEQARHWFTLGQAAARQTGNFAREQGARVALALVAWRIGAHQTACTTLHELLVEPTLSDERRTRCENLSHTFSSSLSSERNDTGDTSALPAPDQPGIVSAEQAEIGWPRTKLGRPFYLTHIPAGHVIKE